MSRTSFTEVYSRKPTECRSYCRESDSKGSQNACSNFIENRKPTSSSSEQHTFKKFIENDKNNKYCRLAGGGNTRGGGGGGSCCCSSKKSSNLSPCALRSTKTSAASTPPSPSPYCRSYKHQQTISQRQTQPQRQERNKGAKGNCPCSSVSNGQASSHNPQELQGGYCSSQRTNNRSSNVQGGCGGHSCGKIYSCAGSSGGKSCFPRNHQKRNGECCGGTNKNSMNHGGCC